MNILRLFFLTETGTILSAVSWFCTSLDKWVKNITLHFWTRLNIRMMPHDSLKIVSQFHCMWVQTIWIVLLPSLRFWVTALRLKLADDQILWGNGEKEKENLHKNIWTQTQFSLGMARYLSPGYIVLSSCFMQSRRPWFHYHFWNYFPQESILICVTLKTAHPPFQQPQCPVTYSEIH